MPMNAMPYKRHQHKVKTRIIHSNIKVTTRSPLFFDLTADEIDSNLIITFQSFLDEADITVIDKNGVTVAFESKASIHEGKTVNVPAPQRRFLIIIFLVCKRQALTVPCPTSNMPRILHFVSNDKR